MVFPSSTVAAGASIFAGCVEESHAVRSKKVARTLARKKVISIGYYPHARAARVH
ncbi:hypothetical protein FJMB80379_15310 [Enterobacter hormaechei]|nr:hypothetical protein FJMB80013_28920 [Enterobacter hormaechei]BDJ28023.1 hypothetical protein FJMB80014_28950 [Enterobacter hormaechei]BDK19785.1 hypothetical protein FJMB80379_15310 [Enterobacter hormaechei]